MATFLNIPTDKFKEILGQQLGQVKGILRAKIKSAIRVLINKFKQRAIESATQNVVERLAPNLCEKTDDIKTGVSQVTDIACTEATNAFIVAANCLAFTTNSFTVCLTSPSFNGTLSGTPIPGGTAAGIGKLKITLTIDSSFSIGPNILPAT